MNYRHIYHAGNFADIAKHVGLIYCLEALKRKDAPFFVLDTHAGRGVYDMQAPEIQKSGEAERGIQRLILNKIGDEALATYFAAIRARRGKRLARYPGSPALIASSLRFQDRAIFIEILPAEARSIDREVESLGKIRTDIDDGYVALKAFSDAYRRWPSAIFLMWYPIRSADQRSMVHARFEALGIPKMLYADLAIHPDDASVGLAGSGLMIINPPYGADEYLRAAYQAIHSSIATPGAGYVEIKRLTPERI